MGKPIIAQRRGKGSPRYRAPSHRFKGDIKYPPLTPEFWNIAGQVLELEDDPGRTAPLARVLLENFKEIKIIAPQGLSEGDFIYIGDDAQPKVGNILPLGKIPEGTPVYNIEKNPGDGGKFVRASGSSAYIVSHDRELNLTYVRLPSKKVVAINSNSRATVGVVAGAGRKDKPFVHAGQAYYAHKARNKKYPKVRGVAMNAVNHPHGGSHKHKGKPTTVSRNAPPGAKVGHIAARRTGRKKK
ncbi:MAG TPA: 50S ribosomal protein L2 [Candidatus Altiarchaeales archaeon]|nr:MAG: 50S ribosomal protein L2 [Candidatus Altiarchaeales archaeon]HDN83410.1 50S ribosomal protein L2 [Candidatus Altiarchaeales archaeon]